MTQRSIDEIKARADSFADAFEDYIPKPGDQDAPLPPMMAMKLAAWRRDCAERELAEAVRAARGQNMTWERSARLSAPPLRLPSSVMPLRNLGLPASIRRGINKSLTRFDSSAKLRGVRVSVLVGRHLNA